MSQKLSVKDKTVIVTVRVPKSDYETFKQVSALINKTPSEYLRGLIQMAANKLRNSK